MITVQETTDWEWPNHQYILSNDRRRMFGYIPKGKTKPMLFGGPRSFDPRGRTFKVLVKTEDV